MPLKTMGTVLPPVARAVDRALVDLDDKVNWLVALSPLRADELWQAFAASGFHEAPEPRYPPIDPALEAWRRELLALPVEAVEDPALQALLREKQRELDRQIELVTLRGTPGLLVASIDLWGDAEPALVATAEAILRSLPVDPPPQADADVETVYREAQRQLAEYRERDWRFVGEVVIDDQLSSKLMVARGRLHIARGIRLPQAQVQALVQHEVGTHVLTRHNGNLQPLRQLAVGLAHYDALQEGLGVLAEYLCGYLSPNRLRILAARVVAVQQVCRGAGFLEIFQRLNDEHGLDAADAFDVTLRALRGGGLTKDAVYLRGLETLLDYLHEGGDLEFLFVGKFALSQLPVLRKLQGQGYVVEPAVLPIYLEGAAALKRLHRCRKLSLLELVREGTGS